MKTKILHAPYIDQTQRWVCGCESVSAVMLLQYLGLPADPDTFIDRWLPRSLPEQRADGLHAENPADRYIGDPRLASGWGCYAPCICTALRRALAACGAAQRYEVRDESGKTAAQLCEQYIDAGLPVVFWATLDFGPCREASRWRLPDGRLFTWVNGEHCLLLTGYDETSFWFNDPWQGHGLCAYPRALVEQRHREQGMYAAAVRPLY